MQNIHPSAPIIGQVAAVLCGEVRPYTRHNSFSAIDKQIQKGSVFVTEEGLAGDAQGDLKIHGGPDKAVHAYPASHYQAWAQELGSPNPHFKAGGFGENLAVTGITEKDICLMDQLRIGTVLLEVSAGRQPCWKLNDRFHVPDMAKRMQQNLRTGWYFRVIETGEIQAEDQICLCHRPLADWSIHKIMSVLYHHVLDHDLLEQICLLPLPPRWLKVMQKRLEKQQVEDWSPRLEGPS